MGTAASRAIIIALGGNALASPRGKGGIGEQVRTMARSAAEIAEIVLQGSPVVLTHGNGPQVGSLLIQQERTADEVPPLPLDVCGAMTQGQIGYLLQRELRSALRTHNSERPVTTQITQVLVDRDDPAFRNPTKPIGPYYSRRESEELRERWGYTLKRVGSGERPYRRLVPSPRPLEIVEREGIRALVEAGHMAVACGGGGVPVVERDGRLEGVEAVIDKDLASERLATGLGASTLLVLTDVERVALRYGSPEQVDVEKMTLGEAERYLLQGEFPPGSMGPKIEAAIRFLRNGGERVVIASLEQAGEALAGRAGTEILPHEP